MMPNIRGELKKVLTVRSSYAVGLFFLALLGIISFYGHGFKENSHSSLFLAGTLTSTATIAAFTGGIIGLLLMAHEYRYNTITYTLTVSNSRSKVIAAKLLIITSLVIVYSAIAVIWSLSLSRLGSAAAHHALPPQDINYLTYYVKTVVYGEGYALTGLLIATLVRNMQAAVAILFIVPNTLESLLSLIIKQPEKWLPFTALNQVIEPPVKLVGPDHGSPNPVTPLHGALVFLVYIVIGWAITWYLFLRRDAS